MSDAERYHFLPPGKLAAVVTFLERSDPPDQPLPPPPIPTLEVRREYKPRLADYRELFRKVGEPWLWSSRLRLSDSELSEILHDPQVSLYIAEFEGIAEGILELDYRQPQEAQIQFLGVSPRLIGTGSGQYLLQYAIHEAFAAGVRRLWLHTCTLDHPRALSTYRSNGFRPYARAIEILDDPRVSGVIPPESASQIPLL